jgi:cell division transport system ATP-binding protein
MIKLENVTKTYKGETHALRGASADIQKGEFVFLVGPSGSGKSTFIRLLNKEETPDEGQIFVAGKDIAAALEFGTISQKDWVASSREGLAPVRAAPLAHAVAVAAEAAGLGIVAAR